VHKNIRIYYITEFLGALVFSTPIWTFFFTLHLGFSIGWAVFITTLVWFVTFLFEIPTGSWADRFGRKNLYIAGIVLNILGVSFYLWADKIYLFVLSAIIVGFGAAIMSGNIEALLHDNLAEKWEEEKYEGVQSNGYTLFFIGRTVACVLGWILYVMNPIFPFTLTIISMIITLPILFLLDEPKQVLSHEVTDKKHILLAFSYIKKRSNLVYVLLWLILLSSIGNMYWFSYQPYLDKIGLRIPSIGAVFAIASAFSAIGSTLLKRLQQKKHHELIILQYLIYSLLLASIGFYFFIKNPSIFWIMPIILISIIFWFIMSLGNSYILKDIPATHKSTSLSVFSFGITLGYFVFAWSVWFLIDLFSMEGVYMGIMLLMFAITLINLPLSQKYLVASR